MAKTGTGVTEREALSPIQAAEERLLLGLRVDEGVYLGDLEPLKLARLADLRDAGFVSVKGGRLFATALGRPVLDRVIADLALD